MCWLKYASLSLLLVGVCHEMVNFPSALPLPKNSLTSDASIVYVSVCACVECGLLAI